MQKICPFCKKITCFFYFAHLFLQNSHVSFFIIYIYLIKYSFFLTIISITDPTQPTQPPSSNHPTTIIKPHDNPATIPFNQATINEIHFHIPIQPSHHQPASKNPNPKIHHQPTQSPSSSHTTKIQRSNHHHHHHQATIINLPKFKDPKTHLSKSQNPLETKENHQQ